jgi:hypothetical protein
MKIWATVHLRVTGSQNDTGGFGLTPIPLQEKNSRPKFEVSRLKEPANARI